MIFGTCSTVSSRIHILSIFDRILIILGLHLETFASTFDGHIFRSQKTEMSFLGCAPGSWLSWTPLGEGRNWEASGPKEARNRIWKKLCQNMCVFLSKVARPSVLPTLELCDMLEVVFVLFCFVGRYKFSINDTACTPRVNPQVELESVRIAI